MKPYSGDKPDDRCFIQVPNGEKRLVEGADIKDLVVLRESERLREGVAMIFESLQLNAVEHMPANCGVRSHSRAHRLTRWYHLAEQSECRKRTLLFLLISEM